MGNDSTQPSDLRANPLARVMNILFRPTKEWQIVEAEKTSWWRLYLVYIMPLAALGLLAKIIVLLHPRVHVSSMIGVYFAYDTRALEYAAAFYVPGLIVGYGLVLFASFVLALFVSVVAPIVAGKKDLIQALKLVAYASIPIWLAQMLFVIAYAIFQPRHISTSLDRIFFLIFVIYAVYLLYLGLPVLMKIPQEKRALYTGEVVGIFVVFAFLVYSATFLGNRLVPLWYQLITFVQQNRHVINVALVVAVFLGVSIFFGMRRDRSAD